jgi:hypothetical protein
VLILDLCSQKYDPSPIVIIFLVFVSSERINIHAAAERRVKPSILLVRRDKRSGPASGGIFQSGHRELVCFGFLLLK